MALSIQEVANSEKEKEELMKVVGKSAPNHSSTTHVETGTKRKISCHDDGGPVSSNQYASGSRMNSGNVITDRPSSRVTQPPGGKSSISFY